MKLDTKKSEKPDKIENWANKPKSDVYEKALGFYDLICKTYDNRQEADESIDTYWNIYNAIPDSNQVYRGNSHCYVPAARDCINARAKRTLKQNFPSKYRHVDAIVEDGDKPYAAMAVLEHYITKTKLKSTIRSLLVAGDVTGQWCLYVDWLKNIRNVTDYIKRNPALEMEGETLEVSNPMEEEEVFEDSEIVDEGPTVADFPVQDLAVIPATCNDIEDAEIVAVKLRMSKDAVKKMIKKGIFILPEGDLSNWMDDKKEGKRNPPKQRASDAGIKTQGTSKYALIYEATARMKFEDGKEYLTYIYYAGQDEIIGIIKAPQWGQKRPVISAPVERIAGSFYGISKIEPIKYLQWNLNDFWNEGQDSAMYSLLPIVMTDPEKNPNYASMVIGLAAVWSCDPQSTQFVSMPALWKDAVVMCQSIKGQINESMDVSDAAMGRGSAGRKNANAVASQMQEASVPIMDLAERMEEEVLNPLIARFYEYDCQFRDNDLLIYTMGSIGIKAQMQKVPPQQWNNRIHFCWVGTDYMMSMQRMQQQIAMMNVLRGIPPQQLNGKKLDITPIIQNLTDLVFGAELSPRILIDERSMLSIDPEVENELMANNIPTDVHPGDDDAAHIQSHQLNARKTGDPTGLERLHISKHVMQLNKKRQEAMAASMPAPQGMIGMPGGAGPGVAGTPRMGAQPASPQGVQNPPGAIHPDQIQGGTPRG